MGCSADKDGFAKISYVTDEWVGGRESSRGSKVISTFPPIHEDQGTNWTDEVSRGKNVR